jgi:antitoxin VapB
VAIYIRDEATDNAIRELARIKGKGLTETIREAVENETGRERAKTPLIERIKVLQELYTSHPLTGEEADKAFFDSLNDD